MSDPNLDAAHAYCSLQEFAFTDFEQWCDERGGDEIDVEKLAARYAADCESGAWIVGCKMPHLNDLNEGKD